MTSYGPMGNNLPRISYMTSSGEQEEDISVETLLSEGKQAACKDVLHHREGRAGNPSSVSYNAPPFRPRNIFTLPCYTKRHAV